MSLFSFFSICETYCTLSWRFAHGRGAGSAQCCSALGGRLTETGVKKQGARSRFGCGRLSFRGAGGGCRCGGAGRPGAVTALTARARVILWQIARFSKHPAHKGEGPAGGILMERELLGALKHKAKRFQQPAGGRVIQRGACGERRHGAALH